MLTAEGCRRRRQRLWQRLDPQPDGDHLVLADPVHLMYLANFYVDPFSLGARLPRLPVLPQRRPGQARLRQPPARRRSRRPTSRSGAVVPWYDGQRPAAGRASSPCSTRSTRPAAACASTTGPATPTPRRSSAPSPTMRRQKDPDEIDAAAPLHARHRRRPRLGARERQARHDRAGRLLRRQRRRASRRRARPVIVYGDFAVSPGPERRGGAADRPRPRSRATCSSSTYSVVIGGYRSDFTNTLVVGGEPTPTSSGCTTCASAAMAAGEKELQAGAAVPDGLRRGATASSRRRAWPSTSRTTPGTAWA